ncbi:hypothetical protein [Sphingobium cupriresistens]|uniref:hypothetical protein n=1 Tax=Sphingobium cupriresistens TaxID=1132417 RepID=UPI003BAE090A
MEDDKKARFRAFADRFGKDEAVLDTGLTGADLNCIASMLEGVVEIPEIDLRNMGGFVNLRPLNGMDWLAENK